MKPKSTRKRIPARPGPAATGLKLPHERDEVPEAGAGKRPEIAIAERDISEGQVDTDNYTRLREVGEAGLRKPR